MSWPALPIFVKVAGRRVVLVGDGEAANAKRRLIERAGAVVVPSPSVPSEGEGRELAQPRVSTAPDANGGRGRGWDGPRLAIVALDDPHQAHAAAIRLRGRGYLVNVVDRPELCDFTVPAIVDRAPVLVAVGTGGVSAGLAAALRQRLEAVLPNTLGRLAEALHARRGELRQRFPEAGERRRVIGMALAGDLDPAALRFGEAPPDRLERIALVSGDPDDLTLRQARWLAQADHVFHTAATPAVILDRARADASRIVCEAAPVEPGPGLSVFVEGGA